MLDQETLNILNSLRRKKILVEQTSNTTSFKKDDEPYDRLLRELKAAISNSIIEIEYFNYSKVNDKTNIEISGKMDNNLNFIFKYGVTNGIYISAENYQLSSNSAENMRRLYVYYDTKLKDIYNTLSET